MTPSEPNRRQSVRRPPPPVYKTPPTAFKPAAAHLFSSDLFQSHVFIWLRRGRTDPQPRFFSLCKHSGEGLLGWGGGVVAYQTSSTSGSLVGLCRRAHLFRPVDEWLFLNTGIFIVETPSDEHEKIPNYAEELFKPPKLCTICFTPLYFGFLPRQFWRSDNFDVAKGTVILIMLNSDGN